jgi:acyl-CoA synthetase (NDP forming)
MPDLTRLLAAQSVAIVGASDRNYYTRSVFENLRALGFPLERITLVNPNRGEAFGVPTVPRLDGPVDVAVVATPKATVPDVVRDLAAAGVGACVVLSDGFAESGPEGARLQSEVARAAGSMLLVGPNTMGVIVPGARLGLWGARLPMLRDGAVATVFQSSGLTNLFVQLLAERRIGLHAAISVGNEAGLRLVDHLAALVEDPAVRVIATFLESVTDGRALREVLERALAVAKPVITLRVGRSERGQRNVIAHTGKLATPTAALDALFAQSGVTSVANVDELIETTALFARAGDAPLRSGGVALVTISGGDCTLLSDLASRVGLALVEPREHATLAEIVGKPGVLGDPLDVEDLLRTDPEGFFRAVEVLARDEQVGILGVRLNLPERPTAELRDGYGRVTRIVRQHGALPVFLSRASENLDPEWYSLFEELGVPFVREYEKALRAIAALIRYRAQVDARRAPRAERFVYAGTGHSLPPGPAAVPYRQAAALVRALHVPLTRTEAVYSADEAVAAAGRVGYPAVVKADVPHKSDLGAVRVGLPDADAVRVAYAEVAASAPGRDVLVQRMEQGVVEAIVGWSLDPQLGPVVTVGIGGRLVEVLGDVSMRLPPITKDHAHEMIAQLRGARLLAGVRGGPPADVDSLTQIIVAIGLADLSGIVAIDLNPVIVRAQGEGAVVVDVLVERQADGRAGADAKG